jgi:hypothetical protein
MGVDAEFRLVTLEEMLDRLYRTLPRDRVLFVSRGVEPLQP